MKRRFILFLVFAVLLCGCREKKIHKDTQVLMGTFVQVISPEADAAGIAFKEIKRVEGLLSKYDSDSEISRLNRQGTLSASPETFFLVKRAREFSQKSGGAFDITVAPLVELWGFKDKRYRIPGGDEIKSALRLVGADKIILQEANNVIKFKVPGMEVDLGGIAKGYAVDCAAAALKSAGIKSCLINAGGQVYCLGDNSGKPWNIAIQDPRKDNFVEYLKLEDSAAATSGDYEQYFIKDGKRYAHIIDPRTGYPAASGISSVTVVGPEGLSADALATAVFVLGEKQSELLLKSFPEYKVKMIKG